MSACALRRWGSGTPCVRDSTPAEKEMSQKLNEMRAEREKQDFMWHTASAEKQKQTQIQPSNSPHIQK
jgi:hypothetical protein